MNEKYLRSLYDLIGSNDSTFQSDIPYEQFVSKMQSDEYAQKMHSWISEVDPEFGKKNPYDVFTKNSKIAAANDAAAVEPIKKKSQQVTPQASTQSPPQADGGSSSDGTSWASQKLDFNKPIYTPVSDETTRVESPFAENLKSKQRQAVIQTEETAIRKGELALQKSESEAERKIEAENKKKNLAANQDEEFRASLNSVNESLIAKREEEVLPILEAKFGKYGFNFTTVGGTVIVKTNDGRQTINIDLANFTAAGDVSESKALRDFISKNALSSNKISNEDFLTKAEKVQNLRSVARNNGDGSESSVKMMSFEEDGINYAAPTLFPKDPNNYNSSPSTWIELTGKDAIAMAKKRGEVFRFNSEEEAQSFAEGAWKKVSTVDIEGKKFYAEKGLDYLSESNKYNEYVAIRDKVSAIEDVISQPRSEAQMAKHPELYINGVVRPDIDTYLGKLKEKEDALYPLVFDDNGIVKGKAQKTREEFDSYLSGQYKRKATEAMDAAIEAKIEEKDLNATVIKTLGVPLSELSTIKTTDPQTIAYINELKTKEFELAKTKEFAANKYEVANTYLNHQTNKNIQGKFLEGWKGVTREWGRGYDNGLMAKQILLMSLGILDADKLSDREEVAQSLADIQADMSTKEGQDRVFARFQGAKGFKESLDVVLNNPAEMMAVAVASSLSQIVPYGKYIVPSFALAGVGTGAIIGSSASPVGTVAGAVTGFGWGASVGFGVTNGALEYTQAVLDAMTNLGYDVRNPQDVEKALNDKAVWDKGNDIGLKRGITIGIIDTLSKGLAGKFFEAGTLATKATRTGVFLAERSVYDPAMEATGEYLAQVVSGQKIDGKEIALEWLGGFGNNAPTASINMLRGVKSRTNLAIAHNLTNIDFISAEHASDEQITNWTNNMVTLKKIDAETGQRILENVGLRRAAVDILSVGEGKNVSKPSTEAVSRVMDLMAAKEELSSTTNRRELNRDKIKAITAEISLISETKNVVSESEAVNLEGIIGTKRQGISQYSIKGTDYTKADFLEKVKDMTDKEYAASRIKIVNDKEIETQLNTQHNAIQEPITEESVLRSEQSKMGLPKVGEGDTQGQEITPTRQADQEKISPTRINVAPFFNTKVANVEEAVVLRQTPEYKSHIENVHKLAAQMGVKANIEESIGGYKNDAGEEIVEVSNVITLENATLDQAEHFAAVLATITPEVQEATIAAQYVDETSKGYQKNGVDEYVIHVDNVDGTIKALKAQGITDYTINENNGTVTLLDFSKGTDVGFQEKVTNFGKQLQTDGINYEAQTKRAAESRYVDKGRRKNLVANLARTAIQQGQTESDLHHTLQEGIKRDSAFHGISEEEYVSKPKDNGTSISDKKATDTLLSTTSDTTQQNIIAFAKKAINTLKSVLPNFDIIIHATQDSYNNAMNEVNGIEGSRGNFSSGKNINGEYSGRIDINLSIANSRTIAHEIAHGIMLRAFGDNQATFNSFRTSISKVLSKETNAALSRFASQYDDSVSSEEYLVELTAILTDNSSNINPSTIQKIATIINNVVSKITNGKLTPFKGNVDAQELVDFLNSISQSINKGEKIQLLSDTEAYGEGLAINVPSNFTAIQSSNESYNRSDIGDYSIPSGHEILQTSKLPIWGLTDKVRQYKGRVVIITSDATGYGVDSRGRDIFGGFGFANNLKNVSSGVGFASVSTSTVKSTYTAADKAYGVGKALALIMIQPPHTTINNSYGTEYISRALIAIGKKSTKNLELTKQSIKDFINNSKAAMSEFKKEVDPIAEGHRQIEDKNGNIITVDKNNNKVKEDTKRADKNKLFALIDSFKADTDVDKFSKEYIDMTTFSLRKTIGMGILAVDDIVGTNKSTTFSKIAFKDAGFTMAKFLNEYGDKSYLTPKMIKENIGGFVVGGFEINILPSTEREAQINDIQSKGIHHPLFKAKIAGDNHFILDGLYYVNENFSKFAEPDTEINVTADVRDKMIREFYENNDKEAKKLPANTDLTKLKYSDLEAARKIELKNMLFAPKNMLVNKSSDVAVRVARGLGFIPTKNADVDMALAEYTSKSQLTGNDISNMIKIARANGFSESSIAEVLRNKGLDAAKISEVMATEIGAAGRVNITETFAEGYNRMVANIEGIVAKLKSRRASEARTVAAVMSYVTRSKVYENATDVQREKLVRDVRKKFGLRETSAPSVGRLLNGIVDPKNVTMTEKQLLYQRIKDLNKGAKDAVSAWTKASKELVKTVRELTKSGHITAKQAIAITNRFSGVNMFDDNSIERYVTYMTKVFNNADYAEKVANANKNLKVARNNIKSKLGIAENLIPILKRILSVNPNMIPDSVFDKYLEMVEMLGERKVVLNLKEISEVTHDASNILEAIDVEVSLAEELSTVFEDYQNKVLNDDGSVNYSATITSMINDGTISQDIATIMRKYKSKILPKVERVSMTEEQVQEEREALLKSIYDTPVYAERLDSADERNLATRLRELSRYTNAIQELTNKELKNLYGIIDNINNGYLPHLSQLLVERMNSINQANTFESAIIDSKPLPISMMYSKIKGLITKKGGIEEMIRRNPLFYIDQLFGDFKTKDIFNSIFKMAAKGQAAFNTELNNVRTKLEKAENKISKSFNNDPNKILMSKFKIMTYLVQLEYESNKDSKQVNSAYKYLTATIKHIRSEKSQFPERNADMLTKIQDDFGMRWDVDAEGNDVMEINLNDLYNSFNPAERAAIATIRGINEDLRDKAIYTSTVIRGDKIDALNNYVHLNTLSETNPSESTAGTDFIDGYSNGMLPSTKAKSLIKRTGKVSPLNFDAFSSAERGAKFVLIDYHLTEAIRTARKTINLTEKMLEKHGMTSDKGKTLNAIRNVFEEATKNLLVNNFTATSIGDDVVNFISKQGYRAILASSTRFVAELTSNVGFALFVSPKAFIKGMGLLSVTMGNYGANVMHNLQSLQVARLYSTDMLSGKMVDTNIMNQATGIRGSKAHNDVANKIQQIYNNTGKKYKNAVELAADALISTPDKVVMRAVWFGSFAEEFENWTGDKPDFEKINSNDGEYFWNNRNAIDNAVMVADKKSVLTGASDNAYMGILKGTTKPNQSAMIRAFNNFNNFMTRFNIYEYTTARMGIMAAIGKADISRKDGVALLAGVTTRMVTYTVLSTTLSMGLVKLVLGDDEEEDTQKSFDKKVEQALVSSVSSLLLGRDFGNATRTIVNYGVEQVNKNYLDFLREGEYDFYKDAIQYSIVPPEKKGKTTDMGDYIQNMGGAFSPMLKTTNLLVQQLSAKEKKTEAAQERAANTNQIRLPLEILGNVGLIPLYKDVRRVVNGYIYKDLKKTASETETKQDDEKIMGMSKTDLKRYYPEVYEQHYGKGTPADNERKIEAEKDRVERELKDDMYNYTPIKKSKNKGFGSTSGGSFGGKSKGGFGGKSNVGFGSTSGGSFGGKSKGGFGGKRK